MASEFRVGQFGGTPFRATIQSVQSLVNVHGRVPEKVVARQLSRDLYDNGIDHVIAYRLDPIPDDEVPGNSGCTDPNALPHWTDYFQAGNAERVEPDANLLLMNQDGGGCSYPGMKAGTAPAANISHDPGHAVVRGEDPWSRNVSAALHEIGRMVGVGNSRIFDVHPGKGWNDDKTKKWHRTPNQNQPGIQNYCGEQIPERKYDTAVSELYFNDCLFEGWKVVEKPTLTDGCGGNAQCPGELRCVDGECQPPPEPKPPGGTPSGGRRKAALLLGAGIGLAALKDYVE